MKSLQKLSLFLLTTAVFISCKSGDKKAGPETVATKEVKLKEQTISYKVDTATMNNYVVYDENLEGPRPVVFVIHEWWGLNDYAKSRARQLAEMGYIAMAIDMYGNGRMGTDPGAAEKLAMPFYMNPELASPLFDSAWSAMKNFSQADMTKTAAIGYCFGGAQAINFAKMGKDLDAVVSFHGNLNVMPANKDLLKAQVLVCHGDSDSFVPSAEVEMFRKQMDSIGAKYSVKIYEGATHAFTNPEATALGEKFKLPLKYNAKADSASWQHMIGLFKQIF
ncbi:MAG TPA: dienelactone hydrolase family protein [Chitinophagaceae bacterium]|nr:dienelactone hydrolase family protein [Chitinophagaceae bacterium]